MDRMVRKLSMQTARTVDRRGFLSKIVRGMVGIGLGAGFVLGSSGYAWADASCKAVGTPNAGTTVACNAQTACTGGDAYGCKGFDPCPICATGGNCADNTPKAHGLWVCCCANHLTSCQDCGPAAGNKPTCICYNNSNTKC